MEEREPNLITSGLSRRVTQDGISVDVKIYRLEGEGEWALEAINEAGTSIVWDDLFPSDDEAWSAFSQTLAEEGITSFLDQAKVIPFRR